ncbi:MAG: RsiV family protein [Lachnospiraceae bacterium]|nr:RsiV family protein [Lachnospiraceae bacterium]
MKKKQMALILAAILLTACGGGAASAGSEKGGQSESMAAESAAESSAAESMASSGTESIEASAAESVTETPAPEPSWPLPDLDSIDVQIGQKFRYDGDYGDNYVLYAQIEWGEARLSPDDEAKYPALAEALGACSAEAEAHGIEAYDELSASAREMAAETGGSPTFSDSNRYYVRRADSAVLSLLSYTTGYSGGAHGFETYLGLNFNPASGERIRLTDLVSDEAGFISYVSEEIDRRYPDNQLSDPAEYMAGLADENIPFTIENNGVTLYFNAYTLGSYAEGAQIVFVPFAGNEKLFNPAYAGKAGWIIETVLGTPAYADFDGDGVPESFLVYGNMDENGYGTGYSFFIDGEKYDVVSDELTTSGFSSFEPMLVHLSDGRDYVYLCEALDNDYQLLDCYQLDSGVPENVGFYPGGFRHPSDYEQGLLRCVMSDPEAFDVEVHGDILSTYSAYAACRVGAEGLPEPDLPWFTLNWPRTLTLKQDLSAEIVSDEGGEVLGEETIPAGSELVLKRSDNTSYADLMLADGRYIRVYVDFSEWPPMVKGVSAEDYFDGMMYAG